MPRVEPGSTVLVTGASGFLGSWISQTLLERGFSVKGTVQTAEEGKYLTELFSGFRPNKFEYAIVADVQQTESCDQVVRGVDGVIHCAANVRPVEGNPDLVINPAVLGTTNILESAKKRGTGIRRVVLTSSMSAVTQPKRDDSLWNENDWNVWSINYMKKKGKATNPMVQYFAAKTLAEMAAWEFAKANEGKIPFDLATLCPSFLGGPYIHEVTSEDKLSSVNLLLQKIVTPPQGKELTDPINYGVDVRDAAAAHVDALTKEAAGHQRFLIDAGTYSSQDVLDVYEQVRRGASALKSVTRPSRFNLAKTQRILGTRFRPLDETLRDTVVILLERGWLKPPIPRQQEEKGRAKL